MIEHLMSWLAFSLYKVSGSLFATMTHAVATWLDRGSFQELHQTKIFIFLIDGGAQGRISHVMQGAAFKALTELCHSCFGFFRGVTTYRCAHEGVLGSWSGVGISVSYACICAAYSTLSPCSIGHMIPLSYKQTPYAFPPNETVYAWVFLIAGSSDQDSTGPKLFWARGRLFIP